MLLLCYFVILSTCLFKIKYSEKLPLYAKKIIEWGPELQFENRSAITNDGVQEVVMLHHYVDNYFC